MNDHITAADFKLPFKEFDKKLRKVHDKRNRRPTVTMHNHIIVRKVRSITPSLQSYAKEDLACALQDIFLELRNKIMDEGFLLKFPYNMGMIRIRNVERYLRKYKKKNRMIDWNSTVQKWYHEGQIGTKDSVDNNMVLSAYRATYTYSHTAPRNLRDYYVFSFMRPFRQAMLQSHLKNNLICYE